MAGSSVGAGWQWLTGRIGHLGRRGWVGWARWGLFWFPVALLAWFGWARRWTCDDAFINFRIVRQLQAGNGPVFNPGDRVEAGTSPVWIFVLAIADVLLPITLEWIAVVLSIAATATGVGLALAGARRLWSGSDDWLIPVGALVYAAVPAAWDFSTSGLETGLGVLWIGMSWWALVRWSYGNTSSEQPDGQRAPWALCLLLGIGPFVRPDFAVFAVCFSAALLWQLRSRRRVALRTLGWLALVPVLGTLARMAYFGLPVPNTAVAKEASKPSWQRGWWYLTDLVSPYVLWLPVLVILAVFLWPLLGRSGRDDSSVRRVVVAAALSGAGLHLLYIVRLGGDFMHGRMLLPALFALLLPFAAAPLPGLRPVAFAVIGAWAVVAMINLRTPQSTDRVAGQPVRIGDAISARTNIHDERIVFRRIASRKNPVTIDDFSKGLWYSGSERTRFFLDNGGRGLVLDGESNGYFEVYPLSPEAAELAPAVIYAGALGIYGYRMPLRVWVLDRFGLTNPITAHVRLTNRGKPGHEKDLRPAWMVAAFAPPNVVLSANLNPIEVELARSALQCSEFPDLFEAQRASLGVGRAVENITGSFTRWRFRMPRDAAAAAAELCD